MCEIDEVNGIMFGVAECTLCILIQLMLGCFVKMELEELESRNEKYPMTRAFLVLLNRLLDIPVPPGLGVGLRVPGFEPYLDFIVHSVLLKFGNRAYKDVNEKVCGCFVITVMTYQLICCTSCYYGVCIIFSLD